MTIKELEGQIAGAENTLDLLRESRRTGSQRLEQLEGERQQYVVAARAGKDADAQKKLCQLNDDTQAVQRDVRDDEAAIAEIEAKLEMLNVTLRLAEKEERRAKVICLIESRIGQGLEKKATDLFQQLQDTVKAIFESDKDIGSAMRAFNNVTGDLKQRNAELNACAQILAEQSAAATWLYQFRNLDEWDMAGKSKQSLSRALGAVKLARIPEKEQLQS